MPNDRNRRPKATDRNRSSSAASPTDKPKTPAASSSSTPPPPRDVGSRRASSRREITPTSAKTPTAAPRNRAEERIKERKQEKRRQQLTTGGIAVAVIIGLIVLAILVVNQPADAPIPPESAARYNDLAASRTEDGYPELGDSPIQVSFYSSFDCAPCGVLHDQVIDGLTERVRAGSISLVYVPLYATGSITNGQGAARAAICAAEQDPSAFWELQDAFYEWQTTFGNQAYTDPRIRRLAEAFNLDMGAFYGCISAERTTQVLTDGSTQARALANYVVTPAIAINGIIPVDDEGVALTDAEAIFAVIDQRIADRRQQPAATTEPDIETTLEATSEAETTPESVIEATAEVTQLP